MTKNRRILLKTLAVSALITPFAPLIIPSMLGRTKEPVEVPELLDIQSVILHDPEPPRHATQQQKEWNNTSQFDDTFSNDTFLSPSQFVILRSVLTRMTRLQRHVGHGNFSLLGYEQMLRYAKQFPLIGTFSNAETNFIDEVFHHDASLYGFMGKKVMQQMTQQISLRDTIKIAGTGNYLFRGEALEMYRRLRKDVGPTLVMTSGIRGMAKQLYLFLAKTNNTAGNLSRASRSLAPPGHSYHGIGDFDVGQVGLGAENFTARFSKSSAYNRLRKLNYIDIRYTQNNRLGVRFEPWHIKVVS